MIMRKAAFISVAFVAAVAAFLVIDATGGVDHASADGGPHGGYTATGATVGTGTPGALPDQCAACHRVHQGQSVGKLLKASSPYALCLTCHNGSGSVLDVLDGIRLSTLIAPATGTVRQVEVAPLTVSVAPVAEVSIPGGERADFTLAIRNSAGAGSASVTLGAPTAVTPLVDPATAFGAAYLNDTPGTTSLPAVSLPAAPSVTYVNVTVPALGTAASGNTITIPVNVVMGAASPTVVISARVRNTDADSVAGNPVLNGGGFMFAAGKTVTSRHNADPADNSLKPWGFSANTGQETNSLGSALQCTSCHNPHGTTNYRILNTTVNTVTVDVKAWYNGAFTKQEGNRGLDTTPLTGAAGTPSDKYVKDYYGSSGTGGTGTIGSGGGLATLCGACHTAYPSNGASEAYTAGSVTHFRHRTEMPFTAWQNPEGDTVSNPETDGIGSETPLDTSDDFPKLRLASNGSMNNEVVTCLTCHRVHGTSTTMNGYALMQGTPDLAGATAQLNALFPGGFTAKGDNDITPSQKLDVNGQLSLSTLLFTNNRGMCQACHQWGWSPGSGFAP